ncbi:MAG: PAS domain S-box protein [Polyangiaceae bacterium]
MSLPQPPSTVDALEAALALSFEAVAIADARDHRLLAVNPTWAAIYGYPRETIHRLRIEDILTDRSESLEGAPRWHRRSDGTQFSVEVRTSLAEYQGREALVIVARDLSKRPEVHQVVAPRDSHFRELMDALPDCVLIHRNGKTIYANLTLIRTLGYLNDDSLIGKPVVELIHPDEKGDVSERMLATAAGHSVPRREERLLRRDGSYVVLEVVAMPIFFEGASSVLALGRDVTERKQIEAQLLTIDRLASLGRLAAAVGHEINNPIAYVLGSLELLRRELNHACKDVVAPEKVASLQERVTIAREGAERVRDIVRDLRTLSRDDAELHRPIDIQRVLELCIDMAGHELHQRAKVTRELRECPKVNANEARLGQVFLNLLINAAQSIPEGHIDENEIKISTGVIDDMVAVDVCDTGVGIASDVRERIFEPFFTTKPLGFGIGLGLSICHHIVTSLGGEIRAIPQERGTLFRVLLPPDQGD